MSILTTKILDEFENPRQQNMNEIILQSYSCNVKWQAYKKMMISDALSRAPLDEGDDVDFVHKYEDVNAIENTIVHSIMTEDAAKDFGDQNLNHLL